MKRWSRIAGCVAVLLGAQAGALAVAINSAHAQGPLACQRGELRGPCMSPDPAAFFPAQGALPAVMVANFALVFPVAGGWEYVCDDMYGRPTPERIRRSPTGAFLLPTTMGLLITSDGCSLERATGSISDQVIFDVAIDSQNPNVVFGLAGTPRVLHRSADGGRSFSAVYTFPDGLLLSRVVVPSGRDQQVYVLGRGRGASTPMGISVDDGATFTMRDAANGVSAPTRTSFEMLAPHPTDPATLYFTIIESDGDELWRTTDAGLTATRLLKLHDTEALGGLAFGATPAVIYVGGRSLYLERMVPRGHLYISRDGGVSWMQEVINDDGPQISCLATVGDQLYACGMGATAPQELMIGASSDEGKTWRPVTHLSDLSTPKKCVMAQCQAVSQWLCDTYTTCAAGQSPADVLPSPPVDAGAGGSGGVRDAGTDLRLPPPPDDDNGCGCRVDSRPRASAAWLLVALALAAARRRRAR